MLAAGGIHAADVSAPYTVKLGDTLSGLARDLLANPKDWNEVARFNAMPNPHLIRPGQTLNIPVRLTKFSPVTAKLLSVEGHVQSGTAPAVAGSSLGEGSRLQTGPDSSAVLELADGSRVQLLPGSLAEIVTSREYTTREAANSSPTQWFSGLLRLTHGAVETLATKLGRRATPLEVLTPTVSVGVRGTRFRVAHDADTGRNSRAEVLEGLVRADNTAQQNGADLPGGTGAVIDPTQKEVRVVQLLPAPDLGSLPLDLTRPQARVWPMPTLAGASAFRVQIASDARFDRIVRDLKVTAAAIDLSNLPNGTWHIRVRGIDPQSLEGFDSARRLMIKDAPKEAPNRWRVSDSRLSVQDGKSLLIWTGQQADGLPMASGHFTADLAADAPITQDVRQVSGGVTQLDLGDLKPGRYFIRLSASAPGGPPSVSETYRMDVPGNWGITVMDLASALQPVGP